MHIISKKFLMAQAAKHPNGQSSVNEWFKIVSKAEFASFDDIRKTFHKADKVGNYVIFNINGNNLRLITAVHFNRKTVFIRALLTHAEYDKIDFNQENI